MSMPSNRVAITKTDELDILSGIWIMSCNDDNPIMTYKGISQRLNLPESYDVKAIVRSRPELFRPRILNSRLKAWKDLMRTGKSRPSWITEIHDQPKQREEIDGISRDDVFRNQFRIEDDAGKCPIEIIDWGLQHIDRLRRAAADERDAKWRIWTSFIIPLASIIVAGVSVLSTVWLQRTSSREEAALKHYEVDFVPKQRAYSSFMVALDAAISDVAARDRMDLLKQFFQMESSFFSLEPFLKKETRDSIRQEYQEFLDLCGSQIKRPLDQGEAEKDSFLTKVASHSTNLKSQLYDSLFTER